MRIGKKNKDSEIKETLMKSDLTPAACTKIGGTFDEKTGECNTWLEEDSSKPDIVTVRKIKEIKNLSDHGGVKVIEDE